MSRNDVLCSAASEVSNYNSRQSVFHCTGFTVGVSGCTLTADNIKTNHCLVLVEMNGCLVGNWLVGN